MAILLSIQADSQVVATLNTCILLYSYIANGSVVHTLDHNTFQHKGIVTS